MKGERLAALAALGFLLFNFPLLAVFNHAGTFFGIPALYVSTGFMLSDALRSSGEPALGKQVLATAEQVARATRLSDLFAAAAQQQETPAAVPGDTTRAVPLPVAPRDSGAKKRDSAKK